MSMRHFLRVAEMQHLYPATPTDGPVKMPPSTKWALGAIADDASDDTDLSWPGLEKIMRWSGTSKRRAMELVEDLKEAGLVEPVSAGFPGRRAVYKITLPDVDNSPVDNPSEMGARSRTPQIMGAVKREKVRDLASLSGNPLQLTKSHTQPHLEHDPVIHRDGTGIHLSWSERKAQKRAGSMLDVDLLLPIVQPVFGGEHGIGPDMLVDVVRMTAIAIIAEGLGSGSSIRYPNLYVLRSVEREPERWRKYAFDVEGKLARTS